MVNCEYCNDKIDEMPRPCKYCGRYFCSRHRQPELHDCQNLRKYSEKESSKYYNSMVELVSELKEKIVEEDKPISNIKEEIEPYNPYKVKIKKKYIYRLGYSIIMIVILILLYKLRI